MNQFDMFPTDYHVAKLPSSEYPYNWSVMSGETTLLKLILKETAIKCMKRYMTEQEFFGAAIMHAVQQAQEV